MSQFIAVASVVSVFVPLAVAFIPKVRNEVPFLLIALLVASFLAEGVNVLSDYVLELNVLWIVNVFSILQYSLIALLYYNAYSVSIWHRRMIVIGSLLFLVGTIAGAMEDPIDVANFAGLWSMSSLLIIAYSIVYLYDVFRKTPVENIITYGQFWINAAMFYHFMLNVFFYFLADRILEEPPENSDLLSAFHSLNNLIKNILFAVGIYYLARPDKKQTVNTSVIKVEDSKVEEVQVAYQRLSSVNVSGAKIVKGFFARWKDDHNGQATPGSI